jgi:hypothetical protein
MIIVRVSLISNHHAGQKMGIELPGSFIRSSNLKHVIGEDSLDYAAN